MKVKFIYTGSLSMSDPIIKLGEIKNHNHDSNHLVSNIEFKTKKLGECLERFLGDNKIKQMNIWK